MKYIQMYHLMLLLITSFISSLTIAKINEKIKFEWIIFFCVITMNINSYLRRNGFCMTYEYMGRSTQISNVIINPFLHGRHFKMERYHRLLHGIKTDYCIPGHMCRSTSKIFWKILNMSSFTIYKLKILIGS